MISIIQLSSSLTSSINIYIIPTISALLANYTRSGTEGAVYGLDNSISSGARGIAPMLGVTVAMTLGLRATFLATAAIFFIAGLLALLRLPTPKACNYTNAAVQRNSDEAISGPL